jgi:hypothetical protein
MLSPSPRPSATKTVVAADHGPASAETCDAVDLVNDPPAYTRPDCAMTLREGLAEHYRRNSALLDPVGMQEPMATFFRRHDCVHVIFGLTTRLQDEVLADACTVFGVDISTWQYARALRTPEVQALLKSVPVGAVVIASVLALPRVWRAFWLSRQQTKAWRWAVDDDTLDTPIDALRQQHGIRLVERL